MKRVLVAVLALSLSTVLMACDQEKSMMSSSEAQAASPKVTTLQSEDTVVGGGKEAVTGKTVVVHYTGTLYPQGGKFDSSHDHGEPFSFRLGAGQVIRGWDEGVVGMREGGKRTLIIPPDKAYGDQGYPPVIPQKATLKFDIELLEVR